MARRTGAFSSATSPALSVRRNSLWRGPVKRGGAVGAATETTSASTSFSPCSSMPWMAKVSIASMPEHVEKCVVIKGRDHYGWTLDGYVIPCLGSGLMSVEEIDLSHP